MRKVILQKVKNFCKEHYSPERPVLLGFSGGPDSTALLYLLLECGVDLHLAHVDHGWREESEAEAEGIKKLAAQLNLPLHLYKLVDVEKSEVVAREKRLMFFAELHERHGFQALVLAHQKDDQAETVLKRLFERAHFLSLGGLQEISSMRGMTIWRPLLSIAKKDLELWHKSTPLDDPSNRDNTYLRARMRSQLLPNLATQFGKEIAGNLYELGLTAQELKNYFERKTAPFFAQIVSDSSGCHIDFNPFFPIERVELQAFLKQFSKNLNIFLSHEQMRLLETFIVEKAVNKKIFSKNGVLLAHRGILFFSSKN